MPHFETSTGQIYYEILGPTHNAGAPAATLVLLHNFMSTGRAAWGPMLDDLTAEYRVVLPDLPGHGQSLGHPHGFHHQVIAEQLAEFLHTIEAGDGHLAGCSSGGMLAQLLVAQQLIKPATLTLVSTTYSVEPSTTGDSAPLTPENFQAGGAWMDATARLHDPYRYDGYYEDVLLPGFRKLTGQTAIDLPLTALGVWALPVCLIHGERDEFFPPGIPQRMAATLPDAEVHLIPRQTHALIFRQPWLVRDRMLDFLHRHPASQPRA